MAINSLSSASHGYSGLASGINTEEVVQKLLSGTQAKMDKAGQRKTVLQYKQSMYRDVATKMRALQTNFMSFTSKTNLMSNAFYNTMNSLVTPPSGLSAAFSVTATSSAKPGTVLLERVRQLAAARYAETAAKSGTGDVKGVFDTDVAQILLDKYKGTGADASLQIMVGTETITIADAPEIFAGKTPSEVAALINSKLVDSANNRIADARFVNNKLEITAVDANDFITFSAPTAATDKSLSMKMFGNLATLSGKGTLTSSVDTELYKPGFVLELDGRKETMRVSFEALDDLIAGGPASGKVLFDELNASVTKVFGSGVQLTAEMSGTKYTGMKLTAGNDSQKFTITGTQEIMGLLDIKAGTSNKLNQNMPIRDLNFKTALQGSVHQFTINGVEFSFNANTALGTIIEEINGSRANVKISYNESQDKFRIESKESGDGIPDITFSQKEGNFLTSLFGVQGGTNATGMPVTQSLISSADVTIAGGVMDEIKRGGVFTFNVNGRDYSFTLKKKEADPDYTPEEFQTALNQKFAESFGRGADGEQAIEFTYDTVAKTFGLTAHNKGYEVKTVALDAEKNKSLLGFGADASTIVHKGTTTLAQAGVTSGDSEIVLNINGTQVKLIAGVDFTAADSMAQLATKITAKMQTQLAADPSITGDPNLDYTKAGVEYDELSGAFRLKGVPSVDGTTVFVPISLSVDEKTTGAGFANLFGNGIEVNQAGVALVQNAGQNAIIDIDGNRIERASNTFTIDGMTFTLHRTTHKDPTNTNPNAPVTDFEDKSSITITRNTDQIVEGITEYLKAYNEFINEVNDLFRAEKTHKDYPPLSQKQKESMSDREIELWEEKAKGGLLRSDQHLEKVLQSLRSSMYNKPLGSSIALYDLGIDTSGYGKDGNFNPTSPDVLKAAIENDPEAVRKLFAGDGGLMEKMNDAINEAAKSSYAGSGYLIREAGTGVNDVDSSIYKQIKEINSQISSLEKRYSNEYNRYWKQFTSMEQMIQQMNTQSGWLSQQFSS